MRVIAELQLIHTTHYHRNHAQNEKKNVGNPVEKHDDFGILN